VVFYVRRFILSTLLFFPTIGICAEGQPLYKKNFVSDGFFQEELPGEKEIKIIPPASQKIVDSVLKKRGPVFVSDDPTSHILPPNEDPKVRINPEAPGPFIAMAIANQDGDKDLARQYANQYVRYQMNFFFEVREMTQLIGQALIDQKVIKDEEWNGVGQVINYEFAKSRKEMGAILKPTFERAMERIKPDAKNQVEVYYFFTLNCQYCRNMSGDVERLWRLFKKDKNVKMATLMLSPVPKTWVDDYKKFTGMTMPIFAAGKQAKAFRIGFVPALVVVTPSNRQAYVTSGKQSFDHMYEFIRKAQGLPPAFTQEVRSLKETPIGEEEEQANPSKALQAKVMKVKINGNDSDLAQF